MRTCLCMMSSDGNMLVGLTIPPRLNYATSCPYLAMGLSHKFQHFGTRAAMRSLRELIKVLILTAASGLSKPLTSLVAVIRGIPFVKRFYSLVVCTSGDMSPSSSSHPQVISSLGSTTLQAFPHCLTQDSFRSIGLGHPTYITANLRFYHNHTSFCDVVAVVSGVSRTLRK
jgi:hypothetical protein